jgi:hypothetical protein
VRRRTTGRLLEGGADGFHDLRLTDDKRVHLLRRAGDRFQEVTSTAVATYNGDGQRHDPYPDDRRPSPALHRMGFSIPDADAGDSVVVGGIMCVPAPNNATRWTRAQVTDLAVQRPPAKSRAAEPTAAWRGGRSCVFMVTDLHLSKNRFTGDLLWDAEIADWRQNCPHPRRRCPPAT